jgi:hypothetical protein
MLAALISEPLAKQARAADLQAALASQAPTIPPDELAELAELLEAYVHGLPSALDALTAMTKEPRVGRSVSFAAGQVLLYLIDEDDLFAERELGAIGLLDDTYLVHACITAIRSEFPQIGLPAGYEPPDVRTLVTVRLLLPAGVTDALDRTCENLVRVAAALFAGNGDASPPPSPERPGLRVEQALGALSGEHEADSVQRR